MAIELFAGWGFYEILLPRKHRLVCFTYIDKGKNVDHFNADHNIFRVDGRGREVWQIKRDDAHVIDWPGLEELYAQGLRRDWMGFASMIVISKDGIRRADRDGRYLRSDIWTPGCTVYADMTGSHRYIIDPDAGVAHIIPGRKGREW